MSPQNRRLLLGGAIAFILLAAIVAAVTAIVVTTKTNSSTGANFQKYKDLNDDFGLTPDLKEIMLHQCRMTTSCGICQSLKT